MKLKTQLIIGSVVLIICVGCGLLLLVDMKNPVEQMAETLLDGRPPRDMIPLEQMTPDLANFIGWYQPMVVDASPEVRAVMKRFDAKYRSGWANRNEEIERWYSTDEWLQRLLDMGIVVDDYRTYTGYLSSRWIYYHAQNDPDSISTLKYRYGLGDDASWDEVVDAGIRFGIKLRTLANQAMDTDPLVYGGSMGREGIFIPTRFKTLYVKLNGGMSSGAGVPKWVARELTDREAGLPPSREIPDDIDIIYLDENGQPLSERVPPSGGDGGETPAFRSSETNAVLETAPEASSSPDDFDNSFEVGFPTQKEPSRPYESDPAQLLKNAAELEKQLTPELPTAAGIETHLSERFSPDRLEKARQVLDRYGSEEGLRRLREDDPEVAAQVERTRRDRHPVESETDVPENPPR